MALTSEVKAGLITGVATLVVGIATLNRALVGVFYDDGLYAGLATALASGLGYVHPNLPGMPPPAAVHYPPLYPVVLAPFFGLMSVGGAALAGKILNALLSAAAAGLIVWHATRTEILGLGVRRWVPAAVVFGAAVAIPVLATQSVLFAEPLFSLLLAVAVIATDREFSPWIAGAAGALALLTRSIGVAIVAGALCFLLARRAQRRRLAIMLLVPLLAAVAWGLWVTTHARFIDPALALGYGNYSAHLRQAGLSAVAVNVPDMSRPLEALVFGWIPVRWLYDIVATVALGVGLYGLVILSRRSAIGLALVFYFLILAIWPHPPDRFLWAVLPWLGLVWVAGMLEIWQRRPRARVAVALLAALVTGGFLHYELRGFAGRWWEAQERAISANFAELLPVVGNLPAGAVVATDDEALVWLYTRRQAVPLYLESYRGRDLIRPTPAEHRAYLERMGVTHVLLASATSPSAIELRGLLGAYPSWLTGIYRWSDGRWLFAVNRGQ
ncbi:MAG TPA: hypothetical protein VEZ49_03035 [Gemmatimonadales bacterium]|nr:hypothetical protein [Gemmatimonadales bacterium]